MNGKFYILLVLFLLTTTLLAAQKATSSPSESLASLSGFTTKELRKIITIITFKNEFHWKGVHFHRSGMYADHITIHSKSFLIEVTENFLLEWIAQREMNEEEQPESIGTKENTLQHIRLRQNQRSISIECI